MPRQLTDFGWTLIPVNQKSFGSLSKEVIIRWNHKMFITKSILDGIGAFPLMDDGTIGKEREARIENIETVDIFTREELVQKRFLKF